MAPTPPSPPVEAWGSQRHSVRLYRFAQILFGWLLRFFFRTRRVGHRLLPKRGGAILATNHASNLDPILVVASMRRPVFHLAKHTLFQNWFTRLFFGRLGGQIPVDRTRGGNEAAIQAGRRAVEAGHALGIYPEGARSPDGRLRRGYTGVARIALLTGTPIWPVAVVGTGQVWPPGKRFPRLFRRTRVVVGRPVPVPRDPVAADDPRRLRELTDRVMEALAGLLGQSYDPATAPLPEREGPRQGTPKGS